MCGCGCVCVCVFSLAAPHTHAHRLERSRASARLRRERKRLLADSMKAQVEALKAAIEAVRNHKWGEDCTDMLNRLRELPPRALLLTKAVDSCSCVLICPCCAVADETDRVLVREQAPIAPLVVQSRACLLVQRHSNVVTNIWCVLLSLPLAVPSSPARVVTVVAGRTCARVRS